jgi:plastocyanin
MAQIDFPDNALDGATFETNGKIYTYNETKNLWIGTNTTPSVPTGVAPDSLEALSNVAISGLQTGQLFYYNGVNWVNSQTRIDDIYLPAAQRFTITAPGLVYRIDEISSSTDNPDIVITSGTTIAFKLNSPGHPFKILLNGSDYNTGLVHVDPAGIVSTGADAQGKETGTLYWQIPFNTVGKFTYRCSIHSVMTGSVYIRSNSGADASGNYSLISGELILDLASSNIFRINIDPDDSITSIIFNQLLTSNNWSDIFTLIITTSTNNSIIWQSTNGTILWPDGTAPTIENGKTYVIKLISVDNGSNYYATLLASGAYV